MLILQPVQQALPGVSPARAPVAIETVAAVRGAAAGDRARNDGTRDRGAEAERLAREAKVVAADPAVPVGPPPAFQANVLEAERARLRKTGPAEPAEASPGPQPGRAQAPDPGERRMAPGDAGRSDADAARREARAESARTRDDRAGAREAPAPTRSAYGSVREDPPRMLDVSR